MPFVPKSDKKKTVPAWLNARRVFVGREQELHFIQKHILEPEVPDHNIVSFYGQGGIGKSTLLSRLISEIENNVSSKDVCLIAQVNERQLTPANVMETLAGQLDLKGEFEKALAHYKEALRKLYGEREQEQETLGRKATAFLAGSVTKNVPLVGDLLSQGAEQVSELIWDEVQYRQRLKDARRLENPLQDLTDGFITELNKLAERQGSRSIWRVLLCFDTFEQLSTEIAPWLLNYFLKGEINENIVLVVAGRHPLSRSTPDDPKCWLDYIDGNILHEIELKTFSKEETISYLAQRGITEETRVNQIWQLSSGLPLYLGMLTTNQDGALDPTADVVQNFLRWIPPNEKVKQRLVLDAALFSQAFNRDNLKAFTYVAEEQRAELYRWLLLQPFVRGADMSGRHSYHEVAQEMFTRYLYTNSPEDCREARISLVRYYQKALEALEVREGEQAHEMEEWLELVLALVSQLLLLPDEEELVHAIELVVQAIGTELETSHREKVGKVLQSLQNGLRFQMTNRTRKTVETLISYQEGKADKPEWYEAINELLRKNPLSLKYSTKTRIIFYFRRADGYSEQKKYEESLLDLDKILELDPQNARAYNRKGNALSDLERYEEALVAYDQAIQLDPTFIYAYNSKGMTLDNLERYEEALVAHEQAIQLDPTDANAYRNKSKTLYYLDRYEEALVVSEQALRLDPSDHYAYMNKILALGGLMQLCKEALTATEQAITLDPSNSVLYQDKSAALNELKRYEEVLAAVNQAIVFNPSELVYRVRAPFPDGRNAWYFILVDQVKLAEFFLLVRRGPTNLEKYGKILDRGWGKNPPPGVTLESVTRKFSL